MFYPDSWAIGAAVARFPDTEEVTGSIPVSPTTKTPVIRGFFVPKNYCVTKMDARAYPRVGPPADLANEGNGARR